MCETDTDLEASPVEASGLIILVIIYEMFVFTVVGLGPVSLSTRKLRVKYLAIPRPGVLNRGGEFPPWGKYWEFRGGNESVWKLLTFQNW